MSDDTARRIRGRAVGLIGPWIVFALFIGVWYLMREWGLRAIWDKPKFLLPAPHKVLDVMFTNPAVRRDLLDGLWLTAQVSIIGLTLAIMLGIGLAVLMSQSKAVESSIWPYLIALQAIPILALVPLLATLAGYGIASRVAVCVIISLFPIVANTLFGLLSVDASQHDLFTLHRTSRWVRLRKLQFPAAMPSIFLGFRTSAGASVIGAIVGDFFFKRGDPGLGTLIETYRGRLNNPAMYGAAVYSALLGISVFVFFGWLGKRLVGHWHEDTRTTG